MTRASFESGIPAFEITGPLPTGITVLEASAGTGKTYTIAALATRYVADGLPLDQLLLVSFTRMATGELRERVRERFVASEAALASAIAGTMPALTDDLDWLLADGSPEVVQERRRRLATAIADFDAATVDTTHGFSIDVLQGLGTLSELEPGVEIVEHDDDILAEVVDDLYVLRYAKERGRPPFDRHQAGEIARAASTHVDAVVYPQVPDPATVAGVRARLATRAKRDLADRKRSLGVMTFDDVLQRLLQTLNGDNREEAARRLRERYRVVLIDEFQDTDPTQWEIVRRAFGDGTTTLVLIADPKQAIYAFRGADVYAYLAAAASAGARATLDVNHRSDAALLAGLDALFAGVRLGHPEIVYRQLTAAPGLRARRLVGAPDDAALRVRVVDRRDVELTPSGAVSAPSGREHVARDVAADIVRLLASGARIEQPSVDGTTTRSTPVAPGDIAVLVRTHREAAIVQRELDAAGVPAVIGGSGSVFDTPAARDWLTLLRAIEQPGSPRRARTAALTNLVGWSADELGGASDIDLEALHRTLHGYARTLAQHGMAALTESVLTGAGVPSRVLGSAGGERTLTDLDHVAELLHRVASEEQLGVAALNGWLATRIERASEEGGHGDERARRLDSDADAVQVLTIHRSKGLEFPVVYAPFLWDARRDDRIAPVYFHQNGTRGVDVGLEGPEYRAHRDRAVSESRGEDLRLLYVALTRARHQAVIWWAGAYFTTLSALSRLMFATDSAGTVGDEVPGKLTDAQAFDRFEQIAARASDTHAISVSWAKLGAPVAWVGGPAGFGDLSIASLGRRLDTGWRRTSYTAITAAAHGEPVGAISSEPEVSGVRDEPEIAEPVLDPGAGGELPLAAMRAGTAVGTVIHRVFETIDFAAGADELAAAVAAACGARDPVVVLGEPADRIAAGLASVLATPLGGALGELALRDVPARERVDELGFELPLAGGDDPGPAVTLDDLAAVLEARLVEADPVGRYAERLRDPSLLGTLRGYLTGSIDLAFRVPGADRRATYAIVDYKTNWLAPPGEPLTAAHYAPGALAAAMSSSHYVLQALLYCVALHRYLRWRAPGYREGDITSVNYLFLRGMLGAGRPTGVFSFSPPPGLVGELSDVLDGSPSRVGVTG